MFKVNSSKSFIDDRAGELLKACIVGGPRHQDDQEFLLPSYNLLSTARDLSHTTQSKASLFLTLILSSETLITRQNTWFYGQKFLTFAVC